MSVIDFIEKDMARMHQPKRRLWILGIAAAAICVGAALGLRRDFDSVFTLSYLAPALLMLLAVAAYPLIALRRLSGAFWTTAILIVLLSCLRPGFPFGTEYATSEIFWQEALSCFIKGLATSLVIGTLLSLALFRMLPLPSRNWQLATALTAGLAGVAMLNLHCASAHVGHIAAGHWLQAIPVLFITYAWQRWLFVTSLPPDMRPRLRTLRRLLRL